MIHTVIRHRLALAGGAFAAAFLALSQSAFAATSQVRGYESVVSSGGDPPTQLPFTGLDLEIVSVIGLGLAMIGAALAVALSERRGRRRSLDSGAH